MLKAHYPLQEDSGDAQDATGNGNAGTVNGATQGATGILGATAYSFDGTDDNVSVGNPFDFGAGECSVSMWANIPTLSNYAVFFGTDTSSPKFALDSPGVDPGKMRFFVDDGTNSATATTPNAYDDGAWHHLTGVWDDTTAYIYVDGVERATASNSNVGNFDGGKTKAIAEAANSGTGNAPADIAAVRCYDHALTPGEVQYLHDVATTGTILTATKTHGSSITPDLRVDVTLNSQAATAYVIGSPGTSSEEVKSATLSNGSNDYTLSWSNSHTDFRVQVIADLSSVTSRVEVNRAALLA